MILIHPDGAPIVIAVREPDRIATAQISATRDEHGQIVFCVTTSRTYRGKPVRCDLHARWVDAPPTE